MVSLKEARANRDGWKPADVRRVLNRAELRRDLIENIRSNLAEHQFAGINIDFESLAPRDREPLVGGVQVHLPYVRADGVRQIYLQDPDGFWVEVNDAK